MEKEKNIQIRQIVCNQTSVLGIGDDQKMYIWNYEEGRWDKYQLD